MKYKLIAIFMGSIEVNSGCIGAGQQEFLYLAIGNSIRKGNLQECSNYEMYFGHLVGCHQTHYHGNRILEDTLWYVQST